MKINERLVKYEAVLILRKATEWGAKKIARALNELGFPIPLSRVNSYLYYNKSPKLTSPLIKSLFYHNAYELALKLKEENNWGCIRIKTEIKRRLGIWVPSITIYYWIMEGTRPSITPLKICPELGYVIGTLMSDCARSTCVRLNVKDKDYAENFVHALSTVTGKEIEVKERRGYYIVEISGTTLRYIVESRLWKVIAFLYPKQFLQGLFDGDGSVGVGVHTRFVVRIVSFTGGDMHCYYEFYVECFKSIKRELGDELWIHIETNDYGLVPQVLDELVHSGLDSVWLDMKAYSKEIYRKLCGTDNEHILELPIRIIEEGLVLEVVLLYIPEFVELNEINKFGELLASVDKDVPVMLLAFFPEYKLKSVRPPSLSEMIRAYEILRSHGLRRVKLGNVHVFCDDKELEELVKKYGLGIF